MINIDDQYVTSAAPNIEAAKNGRALSRGGHASLRVDRVARMPTDFISNGHLSGTGAEKQFGYVSDQRS